MPGGAQQEGQQVAAVDHPARSRMGNQSDLTANPAISHPVFGTPFCSSMLTWVCSPSRIGVCFCKARKHCVLCTALCSHFLLPLPFFQCLRAGSAPWVPIPLSHPCQGRRQTHWCSRTATLLRLFLLRDVVPRCGMEHVSLCFVT